MASQFKKLYLTIAVVCIIALSVVSCKKVEEQSLNFKAGDPAPSFELEDLDGKLVNLEQFKGKVLLINFWATWCAPCVAEMPALQTVAERFRDRGFEIVAISVDKIKDHNRVREFVAKSGLKFVVLRDPLMGVSRRYGVTGFPESIFVSREGKVVKFSDPKGKERGEVVIGDRPWDKQDYIKEIERIIAE